MLGAVSWGHLSDNPRTTFSLRPKSSLPLAAIYIALQLCLLRSHGDSRGCGQMQFVLHLSLRIAMLRHLRVGGVLSSQLDAPPHQNQQRRNTTTTPQQKPGIANSLRLDETGELDDVPYASLTTPACRQMPATQPPLLATQLHPRS
jgi:hypothetical protein